MSRDNWVEFDLPSSKSSSTAHHVPARANPSTSTSQQQQQAHKPAAPKKTSSIHQIFEKISLFGRGASNTAAKMSDKYLVVRRLMISLDDNESLPDLNEAREALGPTDSRNSVQPFYDKVMQLLAERLKLDCDGLMRMVVEQVLRIVDHSTERFSCSAKTCRLNLCKGELLKRFKRNSPIKYTKTFVIGDGDADVCLAMHGNTCKDDFVCARLPTTQMICFPDFSAAFRRGSGEEEGEQIDPRKHSLISTICLSLSGMRALLCRLDRSEVEKGVPLSNRGLKPSICTNQLIYCDARQLLPLLNMELCPTNDDGDQLQPLISVYDIKMELIERERPKPH